MFASHTFGIHMFLQSCFVLCPFKLFPLQFVGKPPAGKIYIRCKNCNVLLIVNKGATAAKCPVKTW